MGDYVKPTIEKLDNAVDTQVKEESNLSTHMGVKSEPVRATAVDVYKESIDTFRKYINGEIYRGSPEDSRKFQRSFITSVWGMLELNDAQVAEVLDYFVKTINEFPTVFENNKIAAPLFSMESTIPISELKRYKAFLVFITLFADNVRDRQRFIAQYDIVKLESMFGQVARTRLHNYVYR
jgi:hypothetical protein